MSRLLPARAKARLGPRDGRAHTKSASMLGTGQTADARGRLTDTGHRGLVAHGPGSAGAQNAPGAPSWGAGSFWLVPTGLECGLQLPAAVGENHLTDASALAARRHEHYSRRASKHPRDALRVPQDIALPCGRNGIRDRASR